VSGLLIARPKTARSAIWYWQFALVALAFAALIGGTSRAFFAGRDQAATLALMVRAVWLLVGLLTLFAFLTAAEQFLEPPWRGWARVVAALQFAAFVPMALLLDNFLVVIGNYVPVMLLFLFLNVRARARGTGTWAMSIGIAAAFAASAMSAAGVDTFTPLDRNGLYHVGMMVAVLFFYRGGLGLNGQTAPKSAHA